MARSQNRKILSGLCAQRESKCSASDAVIQRLTPQKYCNAFQNKVHVASNLRLCTVKSLHEKKNFRLTKICESAEIIIFLYVSVSRKYHIF